MRSTVLSISLGACAGLAALMLTACSQAPDDESLPACLRKAGHDGSLVNVDERRMNDPAYNNAFEVCAAELGVKILPPGEETRLFDQMVRTQFNCMRAAGWDVPEPKRAHGGLVVDGMEANVPADRLNDYDADYKKCTGRSWLHPLPEGESHPHNHQH